MSDQPNTIRKALAGLARQPDVELLRFTGPEDERGDLTFRYGRDFDSTTVETDADFVSHRYLVGSDYGGGVVVRANLRAIREEFEGDEADTFLAWAHGGHNTEQAIFRLDVEIEPETATRVALLLSGLDDYPAISDDVLSEQEREEEEESWSNYGARDFVRELSRALGFGDELELDHDAAGELFRRADDGSGLVQHEENDGSVYFDVERAAERTSPALVFYHGATVERDIGEILESPDEARRLFRLQRIGATLRRFRDRLASFLSNRVDPENGPRMAQGIEQAADWINGASFDIGDPLAELDAEALARPVDRSFRVTFSRWKDYHNRETLEIVLDPFDHGASIENARGIVLAFYGISI